MAAAEDSTSSVTKSQSASGHAIAGIASVFYHVGWSLMSVNINKYVFHVFNVAMNVDTKHKTIYTS